MTDNIITRDEAIDRMKAGLSCETYRCGSKDWRQTEWGDFEGNSAKFRRPPEPRSVAQEFWINANTRLAWSEQHMAGPDSIHVREVLPGDVTLQRMTVGQVAKDWHAWRRDCGWTDDMRHHAVWLASRRALGLIG